MNTHDLMAFRGTPMFCKAKRTKDNSIIVNVTTNRVVDNINIGDVVKWRDLNQDRYHEVLEIIEERPAQVSSSYNGPKLTFMQLKTHEVARDSFTNEYIGLKLN